MTLHLHTLKGCSPAPLAHYLKALGILRLITEQGADHEARGWWQGEHFCLLSRLSREDLETFFLANYEPTPLVSPWNKGSGFYKDNDPSLAALENSQAPRFARFRSGVEAARRLLGAIQHADAVARAIKARTKTNKTFQSAEQRILLRESEAYRVCLEQLRVLLTNPSLPVTRRDELLAETTTIEELVAAATGPATKSEVASLKASAGYNRLLGIAERRFKSLKATLIPDCRMAWRGPHLEWLTAAIVLDENGKAKWPSLFGKGGTDGRLDFTNNLMQRLVELFELKAADGRTSSGGQELLASSIWAEPSNQLGGTAIGQYQPGAAGGANSTTGAAGKSLVNPWDFVLMMEGSVLLSARATRRLDTDASGRASAPFAVDSHAAGYASRGSEKAEGGEQWMPLWTRPATLGELSTLFGEGRAQLNRRTANRPIDIARAIGRLGTARGIDSFTRYGYLERNGRSTLAVPLGQVKVREQPRSHLIDDLAPWLDRLQREARGQNAPARLIHAERRLADAVFSALAHDDSPERWQAILRAAAAIESMQATGCGFGAGPIPALSPEWIAAVGNSAEVRLALSLGSAAAGYSREGRPVDPIRHHWLPLEEGARRFKISQKRLLQDVRVVIAGRDAIADLAALVERRFVEAATRSQRCLPLVAGQGCSAGLPDLASFLSGVIDSRKVLELACAFMALKWNHWPGRRLSGPVPRAEQPDEAWLALRLASLPWPLANDKNIPAESRIVRRLLAGDSAGAVKIALARLRAAGIRPPLQAGSTNARTGQLWAAALAFPIDRHSAIRAAVTLDPTLKGSFHA